VLVRTAGIALVVSLLHAEPARAYSVLAHEAVVDAAWDDHIVPLLRQRYPSITTERIAVARSYAYGGSLIQDLGYYPFGSRLFSNLTHYVRSGDFIEALVSGAGDPDELAFALGALAHYAADNNGHPIAVNRVVPLMYPKVRAEVGSEALYVDSPARHVMVEFAFDVLQVARGTDTLQAYRDRIGFKVAKPLLERAFVQTYGLELDDLMVSVDLAIGTYRRAVGTTIPEMTRIAWREKRDEIEKLRPGVDASRFILTLTGGEYDTQFGTEYRKPGILARVLAFVIRIVPKVGPLRPLAFEPLTPEAERMFLESVTATNARFRTGLASVRRGRLELTNTDFDTGARPAGTRNELARETYADLLDELARRQFTDVPPALASEILEYFRAPESTLAGGRKERDRIRRHVAALRQAVERQRAD
jgi:hypothetical protein